MQEGYELPNTDVFPEDLDDIQVLAERQRKKAEEIYQSTHTPRVKPQVVSKPGIYVPHAIRPIIETRFVYELYEKNHQRLENAHHGLYVFQDQFKEIYERMQACELFPVIEELYRDWDFCRTQSENAVNLYGIFHELNEKVFPRFGAKYASMREGGWKELLDGINPFSNSHGLAERVNVFPEEILSQFKKKLAQERPEFSFPGGDASGEKIVMEFMRSDSRLYSDSHGSRDEVQARKYAEQIAGMIANKFPQRYDESLV